MTKEPLFDNNLKEFRLLIIEKYNDEEEYYTQQYMATLIGKSRHTYWKYEANKSQPGREALTIIYKHFKRQLPSLKKDDLLNFL